MKRKKFVTVALAALGVGATGNGVAAMAYQVPTSRTPPAPSDAIDQRPEDVPVASPGFVRTYGRRFTISEETKRMMQYARWHL